MRRTLQNAMPLTEVDGNPPEFQAGKAYEVRVRRPVEWPENSGSMVRPEDVSRVDGSVAALWGDAISAYREI